MPTTRLRSLPRSSYRSLRRTLLRRRRLLAGVCAFLAVLAGLRATAAPPPETVRVTVAAHDLGAGTRLAAADLTTVDLPPGAAPAGRIRDPVGRRLAGPLRRGSAVTDAALVGAGLARDSPGLVAMPVRLPDSAVAELLRVGDRVDLLAADVSVGGAGAASAGAAGSGAASAGAATGADAALAGGAAPVGGAAVVVRDAVVLALPPPPDDAATDGLPGRVVVLGVPDAAVTSVTAVAATHYLSVVWSS